ncbi:50S ribosomal protein L18 [Candidatus Peribacteria bacterium RIFCSPLOWO2_02_FULL_51_10]|nr:MAG: 50S ribosomal protein L18 [Candidatus Peribacteria bacterium RIFCSPHIGHO2_02_FULL_51_15]OGJ69263.1 MAG: 50S ribosomal protein L18 [Candidatus Peribacteria bacterium RIFCSPLOWO2_02_FULL_51_10]
MKSSKHQLRTQRKRRIRAKVSGISARPRLSVFCSLLRVSAQLIDDAAGKTMTGVTSKKGHKNIAAASKVGEAIAKKAKDLKVETVVFDRNGRKYHGRVKALAEAARKSGLKF